MKKIMFNDKFGLTQAVLEGRKTMTRRIVFVQAYSKILGYTTPIKEVYLDGDMALFVHKGGEELLPYYQQPQYKLGDIVAVAQCYEDAILDVGEEKWNKIHKWYNINYLCHEKGLHNKMFVCADLMPHKIKITEIKVERLQEISDEDCLKEGIQAFDTPVGKTFVAGGVYVGQDARLKIAKGMINLAKSFKTPQEAFSVLIDKISGKGTWESNPRVFAYTFELT